MSTTNHSASQHTAAEWAAMRNEQNARAEAATAAMMEAFRNRNESAYNEAEAAQQQAMNNAAFYEAQYQTSMGMARNPNPSNCAPGEPAFTTN